VISVSVSAEAAVSAKSATPVPLASVPALIPNTQLDASNWVLIQASSDEGGTGSALRRFKAFFDVPPPAYGFDGDIMRSRFISCCVYSSCSTRMESITWTGLIGAASLMKEPLGGQLWECDA
jgi:hypothetical protein